MPRTVKNPKTKNQIQKESDARRGVKSIGFKVPIAFTEELDILAKQTGLTKNIIVMQAVALYKTSLDESQN